MESLLLKNRAVKMLDKPSSMDGRYPRDLIIEHHLFASTAVGVDSVRSEKRYFTTGAYGL